MAAVLLYALITNFLGAKHLHELDYLTSTSSHTSQKQFGFGHLALFTTFIRPGMGMQQGSDKQFTNTNQRGGRLLITFCLLLAGDVHQCPGPMFHTELATKSPKPDTATTSQSPGLQIRTAVNMYKEVRISHVVAVLVLRMVRAVYRLQSPLGQDCGGCLAWRKWESRDR